MIDESSPVWASTLIQGSPSKGGMTVNVNYNFTS
jgi:hypothetical protein